MKNDRFITTKQKFVKLKPKTFTPKTYSAFMRKIVDLNTWGFDKMHKNSSIFINKILSEHILVNYKNINDYRFRPNNICSSTAKHQIDHITNKKDLFYVSSPKSNICMPCMDIDTTDTTTNEDLAEVVLFINSILPCYIERSTNLKGLHCYFFVDFTSKIYSKENKNGMNRYGKNNFTTYANNLLSLNTYSLAKLLRLYINKTFNVKFDNIKGYYCSYTWRKNNSYKYLQRLNAATIIKQPKPNTNEQFNCLINSRIYIPKDILDVIDVLKDKIGYKEPKEPNIIKKNKNKKEIPSILPYINYNIVYQFTPDAFKRSREYGLMYIRKYYINNNTIPTLQEYKDSYRKELGTGEETVANGKRLENVWNNILESFDPSKLNIDRTKEITEDIEKLITKEYLKCYVKGTYNNHRKIIIRDLVIGLEYYIYNLLNGKDIDRIEGRSFSIGRDGLIKYFLQKYNSGESKSKANPTKVGMIKDILCHIGILRCIDEGFIPGFATKNKKGICKRYMITDKSSYYTQVINYYGKNFVESFLRAVNRKVV